uniref:VWFA domain-containing protein n=1 Tax=Knipowitschia caucasica TaxID=637954 RepID=A0AAV2KX47_KNICA
MDCLGALPPLLLLTCSLFTGLSDGYNFDTKNFKIFRGSKDTQFGYTVQQHEAGGRSWLLVGAPLESTGRRQTGDVFRCPLDFRIDANCSRLNLGKLSLDHVSERKDGMRLGMSLTSNPRDSSFVTCGPLWSHECGSSLYSTGICSRVGRNFRLSHTMAPALQRCETFMDIVIVLDGSNSIYPWSEVQDFLINVLQKFYIGPGQTQVGVVQYGSSVVHEFSLGDYLTVDDVVTAARIIDQRGGEETRTALGIATARREAFKRGGRPGAKKVMIVITDGESHDSPDLQQAVEQSERENITLYAIAVLGYYNRRGTNPESFLKEIRFIASDPDEQHFFNVTDESALKDIVDALGERIFTLEGTSSQGRGFGLQMAQAGFSSHVVKDGILLGAVGAYDWTGAVLKETKQGKVVPPKSSYQDEFPEELKNHGAYLGYSLSSLSSPGAQIYVAGAPRFNHTGKVLIFSLKNSGNLSILHSLPGEQIGSYFGSVLLSLDVDDNGQTDVLLVSAPMFYSQGWERGKVYVYRVQWWSQQGALQQSFSLQGVLLPSALSQNSRFGSALSDLPDMNADGFRELVVGAPLEDDHQGAVYVFHGQDQAIQPQFKQRIAASDLDYGLQYFGQSLHGVLDLNADGLVDLSVGARGAAVVIWSRGVVRVQARLLFEPEKVNLFNKDCDRGGRAVTCMSATVCLSLEARTHGPARTDVAAWYSLVLDEKRFPPRAVLDESYRNQPRNLTLTTGGQRCQRLGFFVQETADYGRPIAVVLETGLRNKEEGAILDPDSPTTLRAELPFWNGCEQEDSCVPNLVLTSRTDLPTIQEFCSSAEGAQWSVCLHKEASQQQYVMGSSRRKVVVTARVENQGENAYGAMVHIRHSPNLLFNSLMVKDQADVQIECSSEDRPTRSCNISAPFMKSQSQVSFTVEFELNRSVFMDHIRIVMTTTSDGDEEFPDDNINDLDLPLRYQTELLFTRDTNPPRFDIKTSSSLNRTDHNFNLTYYVQNLGLVPVEDLLFGAEIWSVTPQRNQIVHITDYSIHQTSGSCLLPQITLNNHIKEEDLSRLSQLNGSNSESLRVQCRVSAPVSKQVQVTITGRLNSTTLSKIGFKSLKILTSSWIELESSSSLFLQEERPLRQIVLELRREEEPVVSVWIILSSSVGGLLLLALLVLALWKLGFFNRRRRKEEEPGSSEKSPEGL